MTKNKPLVDTRGSESTSEPRRRRSGVQELLQAGTTPFNDLSALLTLVYAGEWDKAAAAVVDVTHSAVPADLPALDQYRRHLQETLVVARATRARLAAELTQLQVSCVYRNGTDVPGKSPMVGHGGHTV